MYNKRRLKFVESYSGQMFPITYFNNKAIGIEIITQTCKYTTYTCKHMPDICKYILMKTKAAFILDTHVLISILPLLLTTC